MTSNPREVACNGDLWRVVNDRLERRSLGTSQPSEWVQAVNVYPSRELVQVWASLFAAPSVLDSPES